VEGIVAWAKWASAVLVILSVATYVAAKVHFFTRFFRVPLDEHWAEHWPFTAGLVIMAALIWLVGYAADRQGEGARK
jgi:hypothetical protein